MTSIEGIVFSFYDEMSNANGNIKEINDITLNQNNIVETTLNNYDNIKNAIVDMVKSITDTTTSLEKLKSVNRSMYNSISNVNNITTDLNRSVVNISKVVLDQFEDTKNVDSLIKNLDSTTKKLEQSMNKFII
jgi:methyl-accepting chemotaxis protein